MKYNNFNIKENRSIIRKVNRFLLKGVNVREIEKKYKNGFFSTIEIPKTKVTYIKGNITSLSLNINNDCNYISFPGRLGENKKLIELGGRNSICQWCRIKIKKNIIGIPLYLSIDDDKINIIIEGSFCSYNCCYARIKDLLNKNSLSRNQMYENAENNLKVMFNIDYPNESLIESYDWILHENNGGFIKDSLYRENMKEFINTKNIRIFEIYTQYQVID